jgi:molecular chaperone IbpA
MTNLSEIEKFFVGFDNLRAFPHQKTVDYPKFNLAKVGNQFRIDLALAGWTRDQVSLTLHKNQLLIKGEKQSSNEKDQWIHKGISGKGFERSFNLDADLEVVDARMENGLLSVTLGYVEASRPIAIEVA